MRQECDWVTDEVRNLSHKKDAWIRLCNNRTPSTVDEYNHLCKTTKLAADKARNAWWSARAEEAERRGVHIVYHPDAKLVGDCRKMLMETLVTDLEYADDMALVSSSWSDLEAMIRSLNYQCNAMGLTISCKKTKTLAVLPSPSCQQPEPILLSPGADPVEPVTTFQ